MDIVETTVRKFEGALDRAEGLLAARLVQDDALAAVQRLLERFKTHRDSLVSDLANMANAEVVATRCDVALAELVRYTPLLGLIHRSKSSANPFEMYGPLLALGRQVIGREIRLVVSSEWDYSPFTMAHGTTLDGFVFVGMPATIPDKALLIPLAGHEFGHSVWAVEDGRATFEALVFGAVWDRIRERLHEVCSHCNVTDEAALLTLDGLRSWRTARSWALLQTEELFCDLIGFRLFGTAYAQAFAYLLAPGLADHRVPSYPVVRTRAEVLQRAAARWELSLPAEFLAGFRPAPPINSGGLLGEIADAAALDLVDRTITEVEAHGRECGLRLPRAEVVDAVRQDLSMVVPSDRGATLAELLCAAWQVGTDSGTWASLPHILAERHRVLDDLVLKSAQIMEYHHRIGAGGA
jgi:hypothetical protein